ncbi:exopolyphosphatase, partial [Escherichia coli]|nr:exopolyphosphatase [Escherichia coli]
SVRRWFGWSSESILNLDMGGGSLELALGVDEFPQTAFSVPLGAGRLTREWLPNDLPSMKEVKELRTYVRDVLADPTTELRQYGKPTLATATSKTFRSLARITGAAPSTEGPYVKRVLHRD